MQSFSPTAVAFDGERDGVDLVVVRTRRETAGALSDHDLKAILRKMRIMREMTQNAENADFADRRRILKSAEQTKYR